MTRKRQYRRRRRRDPNFVAIPFHVDLALGTLNSGIAITAGALATAVEEDLYVVSTDVLTSYTGHTALEGPFEIFLAHGDLTTTEMEQALTAEVNRPDDIIQMERARRPVRRYGIFSGRETEADLNHGMVIRRKVLFGLGNDKNLRFGALNRDTTNFTTGTIVSFSGTIYGRWQR